MVIAPILDDREAWKRWQNEIDRRSISTRRKPVPEPLYPKQTP
jgi:hypothetical protein